MFSGKSHGQEAVRMSLASEQVAAAQYNSPSSNYFNVQAGPVFMRFQGELGLEFNSDVDYSHTDPLADVGFRETLNLKAYWPVTARNTLSLSAGIGYVEYVRNPAYSHLSITSDSGLAFNVYSGDLVFNLHDRISAVDYQVQDPSVSATLIRLENTVGLETTWDLYKLVLSAGYDLDTYNSLTETYRYSDDYSDLFNAKAAFLVSPTSKLGLEAGGGVTSYAQNVLDNSSQFSVGPFYQARFTPHLSASLGAGFTSYQFGHNGAVTNLSNFEGFYANAFITHQLTRSFLQSLSAGRQLQRGITADLSEDYYVNYQAKWNFLQNAFATFRVSYDHGSTHGAAGIIGYVDENYDRFGSGFTLGWQITEKLLARASYDFLEKTSDVSNYGYTQNRILLDFAYDF
jgi:hypothetical protein